MAAVPTVSYALNSVAYDPKARILQVQYGGGKGYVYRYLGVPPEVFRAFKRAWSLGVYMNERIKPRFPFERLTPFQAAVRPLHDETQTWTVPLMGGPARARLARRRRGRPVSKRRNRNPPRSRRG